MTISLAEELVLLAYNDEGSAYGMSTWLDYGVAGAHLVELALAERIELRDGRVTVIDATPTGSPPVDAALATIAADDKPRKAQDLIYRLSKRARTPVLDALVERGILERRAEKVLRIIPVTRYPSPDGGEPAVETERRRLMRAAVDGTDTTPDTRTLALCTLVHALDWERRVFPDLPKRETRKRLKELGEQHWAGVAVGRLVKELAALIASTVAAITVAAAAGA
ncbi:GOLPH3/VPS74 family protein [Catenuloplanes atrovinosus]|uniref:Golgi phosphoprotein 3 GPP34 n=1 Tax=Catenuloplanes atrovinosus TaxID=137266 RepID=A0AAE3YP81_9ACTN|nr:GPP34 family phosphoprotein [Catenuloplanes atrovinosus]MDR7276652.1 hypothetical protein [Catenuloplanes atrovinosus]